MNHLPLPDKYTKVVIGKLLILGEVLEEILDEAALTQSQGGALNYGWMLERLKKKTL